MVTYECRVYLIIFDLPNMQLNRTHASTDDLRKRILVVVGDKSMSAGEITEKIVGRSKKDCKTIRQLRAWNSKYRSMINVMKKMVADGLLVQKEDEQKSTTIPKVLYFRKV
jgi:hypothetical protein